MSFFNKNKHAIKGLSSKISLNF